MTIPTLGVRAVAAAPRGEAQATTPPPATLGPVRTPS